MCVCVWQAELIELGSLRGAQPHCLATMQQPVAAIGAQSMPLLGIVLLIEQLCTDRDSNSAQMKVRIPLMKVKLSVP